jgi:hypothetical protein
MSAITSLYRKLANIFMEQISEVLTIKWANTNFSLAATTTVRKTARASKKNGLNNILRRE